MIETKLKLTSPDFGDQQKLPSRFGYDEENVNPTLLIHNVPTGTKSLAIIMHDPDAVSGDWTHWTLWNISPEVTEIPEGSEPYGSMEGTNSWGETGWGGPAPPPGSGTHRYTFEVYALDDVLDLPHGSSRTELEEEISEHLIEEATLCGLVDS
jgi:Raf kinase inhibitor-like YbhB/YbcL family protein